MRVGETESPVSIAAPPAPIVSTASPGLTLVTGATGFLGSAVARALVLRGWEVRVLARPNGDRGNLAGLKVDIAEGTLEDAESLNKAVAGCRYLFHIAADYRLWVRDKAAMLRANVDGTRLLMEAARSARVERIVYTSSVATLGLNSDGTPADEATPVTLANMIGTYKRSKFLAEEVVRDMVKNHALPAVIVNPSTPIGPRDIKPTPTGRMIVEAASGRMPAYVDTGLNFVHVDDCAAGHLLALDRGTIGERYILGGENLGLGEMLRLIAQLTGRRPPFAKLPRRALMPFAAIAELAARLGVIGEPFATLDGLRLAKKKMYFRIDKARAALNYQPRPIEAGFSDAIAWFADHGYVKPSARL